MAESRKQCLATRFGRHLPTVKPLLAAMLVGTLSLHAAPSHERASRLIDMLVESDLEAQGLKPNPIVGDLAHLRRATLAIAGRIPTYDEIQRFEADNRPDKRSVVVDHLLESPDYARHLYTLFADFLRLRTHVDDNSNLHPYRLWLQDNLNKNTPYDELVRAMLTAEGNQFENPAAGYYLRDSGMPLDNLAITTQVFLGTRMQCAQCHNHPTEKWKQVDFFKLASLANSSTRLANSKDPLLAAMDRAKREKGLKISPNLNTVFRAQITDPLSRRVNFYDADARLPHDYAYDDYRPKSTVPPAVPLAPKLSQGEDETRIAAFASWLTSDDNEHFSMVMVNRLWKQMIGRGLFEPMDNVHSDTVISNKPLLTYLSQLFRDLDYDLKAMVGILAKTTTFQRQALAQDVAADKRFHFQGPLLRRMTAEQVWDSFVFLLRGNPGLKHPHLQNLEAEALQASARFHALKSLPPDLFVKRLLTLQEKTDPLDQKIRTLRQKIPDLPEAEKRQVYNEIRDVQQEAAAAFWALFPELTDEGGGMKSSSMTAMTANAMRKVTAMKTTPPKMPRSRLDQKWDQYLMASANMVSPVNSGHELLVFGASERELADAASTEASVPQALIMLNGDNGPSLFWEETAFKKNLEGQKTDEEAVDCLFLSLLGDYPDDRDRILALEMIEKYGRFDGLRLTALSLTQTARFIFIH